MNCLGRVPIEKLGSEFAENVVIMQVLGVFGWVIRIANVIKSVKRGPKALIAVIIGGKFDLFCGKMVDLKF